jgi:hypothetical protein
MSLEDKSHKRARDVVAAYGAEPRAWPDEYRADVHHALSAHDDLAQQLSEARALDDYLNQSSLVAALDGERVARQIAQHILQQSTWRARLSLRLEALSELMSSNAWKPVFSASIVLSAGVALGSVVSVPAEDWSGVEQYSFTMVGEEY